MVSVFAPGPVIVTLWEMVGRALVKKMVPVSPDWNWIVLPAAVLACAIAERSVGQLRLDPAPEHEPNESPRLVTVNARGLAPARVLAPENRPAATERLTSNRCVPEIRAGQATVRFERFLRQDMDKPDTNFRQNTFRFKVGS